MRSLSRHTTRLRAAAAAALLSLPALVPAAPSGTDLLNACRHSLENGFDSIEGSLCAWYVMPCNCGLDSSLPKVCLPEEVPVEILAREIVQGLKEQPILQDRAAGVAAAAILSGKYPCPAESRHEPDDPLAIPE